MPRLSRPVRPSAARSRSTRITGKYDAARGGSLVAAQTAAALAGVWPAALLRDVAAVTTADFALHPDGPNHPVDASLDLIAMATVR